MPAAARVSDIMLSPANRTLSPPFDVLPMPIVASGTRTVLIGGIPAALRGDHCGADTLTAGSTTVLIEGRPAARVFDMTANGGFVMGPGYPTVLIGG